MTAWSRHGDQAIWVNCEDHITVISVRRGAAAGAAFELLRAALDAVEKVAHQYVRSRWRSKFELLCRRDRCGRRVGARMQ